MHHPDPGPPPPAAKPAAGPGPLLACPNCGESFGPGGQWRRPFCPGCGQETQVQPPTVGEFIQQFGGAYLSTEGALWRTLKLLLLKPGELTVQYLAGRRRHFVLPLRLYLTISLLVLLALRMVAHVQIEAPDAVQTTPQAPGEVVLHLGSGEAGLRGGVFFCERLPTWVCQRIQRRIDVRPEAMVAAVRAVSERFVANLGASLFVLVPGFALWMKLAYLNRRLRFTEHLVFALHLHAFWFLMLALTLLPLEWLKLPALAAVPAYALLATRRVYGGRWWPLLLRAGLVTMLYAVLLSLALAGLALWSVLA